MGIFHSVNNLVITRGKGWDFYDCTFEDCNDSTADGTNYPNGGLLIQGGATLINPWFEGCDINLESPCTVAYAQVRTTRLSAPCNIQRYFADVPSKNLVQPIYTAGPAWPDSFTGVTVDKSTANLTDGKRYTSITSIQGAGTSKKYISEWNEEVSGLEYSLYPAMLSYVGVWVQLKTAIPGFNVIPVFEDWNGTVQDFDSQIRVKPKTFSDSTLDTWQYYGFVAPIRDTYVTAYPIRRVRLVIEYGASGDDFSSNQKEFWLAEPCFRAFVNPGHPLLT